MKLKKYNQFLELKESKSKEIWDIIPPSVKELHKLFQTAGKKLYLVGGSVRDFLTGDQPKDFDLATDAFPDDVLKILGNRYKTNLQGKAFGVVVAYTKDQPKGIEIATFRQDVTRGRNPEVKLGVTIEDDVKRRDITYNSLFYDLDKKEIVDIVGGKKDLESGITRMVGDPHERFEEDSLRILRAFRFAARYGHPLHHDTEMAIKKRNNLENIDPETGKMKRISQERIWEEMKKAFDQAKDYNYYLSFFNKFHMWEEVFPNFKINTEFVDSKDFAVIIANLFKNEDPSVRTLYSSLVQDYKIETDLANKIIFLLYLLRFKAEDVYDLYKKRIQSDTSDSTILEWVKVMNLPEEVTRFVNYKPSISSQELMDKGFKGKELGDQIKRLETEKFKSGI